MCLGGCYSGMGSSIIDLQENAKGSRKEPGIGYIFLVQKLKWIVQKEVIVQFILPQLPTRQNLDKSDLKSY